jgi:hypothetical protein
MAQYRIAPMAWAQLTQLLHYDPQTGVLKWKLAGRNGAHGRAGYFHKGMRRWFVTINAKQHLASRIAWFLMTKDWPRGQIDHKNGNCEDDRFSNLRDGTSRQNQQNQRRPHVNNKSGFLGVSLHKGRWRATIKIHGKYRQLGYYNSPEIAHMAYVEAKRQFHEFGEL